ncbi:hypothetical protein BDQ12DRAFT_686287 [Crucibulum laeve]|uniref:Uncharacterized protein n=1 Tax=Crucibulum laeve TaxID=68775 RepID=A0A5C3LWA5_9AGAR|nr:hypothetical protein BDQ12DRAFT_686287 [Crucibulum laeve]
MGFLSPNFISKVLSTTSDPNLFQGPTLHFAVVICKEETNLHNRRHFDYWGLAVSLDKFDMASTNSIRVYAPSKAGFDTSNPAQTWSSEYRDYVSKELHDHIIFFIELNNTSRSLTSEDGIHIMLNDIIRTKDKRETKKGVRDAKKGAEVTERAWLVDVLTFLKKHRYIKMSSREKTVGSFVERLEIFREHSKIAPRDAKQLQCEELYR